MLSGDLMPYRYIYTVSLLQFLFDSNTSIRPSSQYPVLVSTISSSSLSLPFKFHLKNVINLFIFYSVLTDIDEYEPELLFLMTRFRYPVSDESRSFSPPPAEHLNDGRGERGPDGRVFCRSLKIGRVSPFEHLQNGGLEGPRRRSYLDGGPLLDGGCSCGWWGNSFGWCYPERGPFLERGSS